MKKVKRPARGDTRVPGGGGVKGDAEQRDSNISTRRLDPRNGKMTWAKVYPNDFWSHIRGLSDKAIAGYVKFWIVYLDQLGVVADNDTEVARLASISTKKWKTARAELVRDGKLISSNGYLTDPLADRQIEYFKKRSATNRQSVGKRWYPRGLEDAS